jgi:hypothetical protein
MLPHVIPKFPPPDAQTPKLQPLSPLPRALEGCVSRSFSNERENRVLFFSTVYTLFASLFCSFKTVNPNVSRRLRTLCPKTPGVEGAPSNLPPRNPLFLRKSRVICIYAIYTRNSFSICIYKNTGGVPLAVCVRLPPPFPTSKSFPLFAAQGCTPAKHGCPSTSVLRELESFLYPQSYCR